MLLGSRLGRLRRYAVAEDGLRFALSGLLHAAGIVPLVRWANNRGGRASILMYHSITADADRPGFRSCLELAGMTVTRGRFEEQMHWVARHCRVLPLEECLERLRDGKRLPPNAVVLTFDDGFRDNFLRALPVLRRFGLPATFFVVGEMLSGTGRIPRHWIYFLLDLLDGSAGELNLPDGGSIAVDLTTAAGKEASVARLRRTLAAAGERAAPEVARQLEALCAASGRDTAGYRDLYMSASEVASLRAQGFSAGAHSMTHRNLGELDPEEALAEATSSRDLLERICGTPVRVFAYPFGVRGSYNERLKAALRRSGFIGALSTEEGVVGGTSDRFALRRIGIGEFGRWEFTASVSGATGIARQFARTMVRKGRKERKSQ